MPIWQFFRQDQDGHALFVWPSRILCWIFAFGSYEFLAMLEGKTRKGLFFSLIKKTECPWKSHTLIVNSHSTPSLTLPRIIMAMEIGIVES